MGDDGGVNLFKVEFRQAECPTEVTDDSKLSCKGKGYQEICLRKIRI